MPSSDVGYMTGDDVNEYRGSGASTVGERYTTHVHEAPLHFYLYSKMALTTIGTEFFLILDLHAYSPFRVCSKYQDRKVNKAQL